MKNLIYISLISILCYTAVHAQNTCSKFYPLKEGTRFQLTGYDKNDKPVTITDYEVKESTGDEAAMAYTLTDEKGKVISTAEYKMKCKDNGISIDFTSLMSPAVFEQYKDAEVELTGTDLVWPNNLSVGQSLPNAEMDMEVKMTPLTLKLNSHIYNRKVIGKETITTPAGTFDCFVISYDQESKLPIKFSGSGQQWLAEDLGLVQQIDYNKKGKLRSKTVLTKFEK